MSQPPASGFEQINAVTLVTSDMPRSLRFYDALGFEAAYGGPEASFTSLRCGEGYVNLMLRPEAAGQDGQGVAFWGRVIMHVSDVDAVYERALEAGLQPEAPPRDAEWGERYFHIQDPDGHNLSFARRLG